MSAWLSLSFAFCVLALSSFAQSPATAPDPDPDQESYAKLSGDALVLMLLEEKSRARAYYELWRRIGPGIDEGFDGFIDRHHNLKVIVCPQGNTEKPIYLVQYDVSANSVELFSGHPTEREHELFPAAPGLPLKGLFNYPHLDAFDSEGRGIRPFDSVFSEKAMFEDITGDQTVERVAVDGEEQNDVHILTISTVRKEEERLFTLVYNSGADEWTFRLTDLDGDGIVEIEAGPRTLQGFKPKAAWKWNPAKRAYQGPKGSRADHFLVIDAADLDSSTARLTKPHFSFPNDPEAAPSDREPSAPSLAAPPAAASVREPYKYISLKGASDAAIMQFMASGKSEAHREFESLDTNRVPDGFWTMEPKQAALALVEANRSDAHRATHLLAIDDRQQPEPPAECTIAFSPSSSACYEFASVEYFLHVDPQDSYLALVRSWSLGAALYNVVYDQPFFDLRFCRLRYEDARHFAAVIWWLERIRSRDVRGRYTLDSLVHSTADGGGQLTFRTAGQTLIDRSATIWTGPLPLRWKGEYNHEAFVSFNALLFGEVLPARLGNDLLRPRPDMLHRFPITHDNLPTYTVEEKKRLTALSEQFLAWFTPGQERLSFAIVAEAALLSAHLPNPSAAERLREIEAALPPPGPPKRSYEEVSAERNKLRPGIDSGDPFAPIPVLSKEERRRAAALDRELDEIRATSHSDNPHGLRKIVALARRQLESASDAERLQAWATSSDDGWQWALQRLAVLDQARYAAALEALVRNTEEPRSAREFFAELRRIDSLRAAAIARALPPEKQSALSVSAFALLQEAQALTDEAQRLSTIIQILHDPEVEIQERSRALALLVPLSAPQRYPGPQVDDALLKLLDFEPSKESRHIFPKEEACYALALRGRIDLWERIERCSSGNFLRYPLGAVGALVLMVQSHPQQLQTKLQALLQPHLQETNASIPAILWAIAAADLRELEPELARLATHDPAEYEDRRANAYGGEKLPVTGRFHVARKILALWQERDAFTRARLLTALAVDAGHDVIGEDALERAAWLKAEMHKTGAKLSADEKEKLAAFLDAIDSETPFMKGDDVIPDTRRKVAAFARREFRL